MNLGAFAGPALDGGAATMTQHPPEHRIGQAAAIGGDRLLVESLALIGDPNLGGIAVHLQKYRDAAASAVLGGVDQRLGGGAHQGPAAVIESGVAHLHQIDGDVAFVFHFGHRPFQGGRQQVLAWNRGATV